METLYDIDICDNSKADYENGENLDWDRLTTEKTKKEALKEAKKIFADMDNKRIRGGVRIVKCVYREDGEDIDDIFIEFTRCDCLGGHIMSNGNCSKCGR